MKIFIGFDPRQPIAYNVLRHSIERRASEPFEIHPLMLRHMPVKRRGLTDFSFSRYLVPYLCNYEGFAIFIDPDMICLADMAELIGYAKTQNSVAVVDHSKNGRRFENSSLMLFNNEKCKKLTLDVVDSGVPQSFEWADQIGEIPPEWNHLVGYDKPNPNAKIIHYTMGIPIWVETKECEYSKEWHIEAKTAMSSVSFAELMGNSVHVPHLPKLQPLEGKVNASQ